MNRVPVQGTYLRADGVTPYTGYVRVVLPQTLTNRLTGERVDAFVEDLQLDGAGAVRAELAVTEGDGLWPVGGKYRIEEHFDNELAQVYSFSVLLSDYAAYKSGGTAVTLPNKTEGYREGIAALAAPLPPELRDHTAGTDVDMSSATVGGSTTVALEDGLYHLTWTADGEYWERPLANVPFDVRMRLVSVNPTGLTGSQPPAISLFVWNNAHSSRIFQVRREGVFGNSSNPVYPPGVGGLASGAPFFVTNDASAPIILRIAWDGGVVSLYYSQNEGRTWIALGGDIEAFSHLTLRVGAWLELGDNVGAEALVQWVRAV